MQAHAGAYFAGRVLDGLNGMSGVKECTFVESTLTDAPFFSSPVRTRVCCVAIVRECLDWYLFPAIFCASSI